MMMFRKCLILTYFISIMLCISGCAGNETMFTSYMENKYEEAFTCIEPTGGQLGSPSHEAWMGSSRFPGERILVGRYKGNDGKYRFYDNYMAFLLHGEAQEALDSVTGEVFQNYRIFFKVPPVVLNAGPENYGLDAYLKDPMADLSITIISCSERDESKLKELAEAFGSHGIAVKGILFFTGNDFSRDTVTEENIEEYEYREGWYRARVNFSIEEDGSISYEHWNDE